VTDTKAYFKESIGMKKTLKKTAFIAVAALAVAVLMSGLPWRTVKKPVVPTEPVAAAPKADSESDAAMRNSLSILDMKPTDSLGIKILKGAAGVLLGPLACKPEVDDPVVDTPVNKPTITTPGTNLSGNTGAMTNTGLTVNLTANVTTGNGLSCQWVCTGYNPGSYTVTNAGSVAADVSSAIGAANAAGNNTNVTLKKAGTYTFVLKATNSAGMVESSPVTVNVTPWNATKDVEVSFDSFTLPASAISLVPKYTATGGWDSNFSASDITSKITYTFQGDGHTQVFDYAFDTVTSARQAELNSPSFGVPWPPALYKQTFYYKSVNEENKLGEYAVYMGDIDLDNNIGVMKLNDSPTHINQYRSNCTDVTSLPPVPLKFKLSKEIAEL
jgi:hypothetical protein